MNRLPEKRDASGKVIPEDESRFSKSEIESREFVRIKASARPHSPEPSLVDSLSSVIAGDRPEDLVDRFQVFTLEQIESMGLVSAKLKESPWSGDYWPIRAGVIAKRYSDPEFPDSQDWKVNVDYVTSRLSRNSSSMDYLSPAEKYDLLVGDSNWTLTRHNLDEGKEYQENDGSVEAWMGICHGWAPASFMVARPTQAVKVLAADQRTLIEFRPTDIKALASLLWAEAPFQTRSVGQRCNVKQPKTDSNGRIIDPVCFDTNPATWHLALVNQIGVSGRSFILDASFDYQVWNQPVYSYTYTLFNPNTEDVAATAREAKVPIGLFTKDKFRKYRSANAAWVVGVVMEIEYLGETSPSTDLTDGPDSDRRIWVRYVYDLELDAMGRIIGGEWYNNAHPDFLWTPAPGAKVFSVGDRYLDQVDRRSHWDGRNSIPSSWRKVAPRASGQGQPLARIVEGLILSGKLGV